MKWRKRPSVLKPPPDIALHREESEQAVNDAQEALEVAELRKGRVNSTVRRVRHIRQENDFANTFKHALGPDSE